MRAYLKNIVGHSGYSSCERCTESGEYHDRTVVFPNCNSPLRSNDSFSSRLHERHHKPGPSPIEDFGLNMVSDFVIDYMHCCLIGTIKR